MSLKKSVYLPTGVLPKEDFSNEKKKPARGTIRYPNSGFYSDFYSICSKAKVSMNEVLVGLVGDFIEINKHLLEKIKNK